MNQDTIQCAIEAPRDMTLRAEVILLNDRRVIRVKRGDYLIGYFDTVPEVETALDGQGLSMADIDEIKEQGA